MTAATPMMRPSIVKPLRSLLTRTARPPVRRLCQRVMPPLRSEPDPRRPVRGGRRGTGPRVGRHPSHDDLLAFAHALEHLGHLAISDSERHRDRSGPPVPAEDPHAASDTRGLVLSSMAPRPLVEFRALLRGQDLTDALAPGLPELLLLLLRLALVLPLGAAQGVALAAAFVEDRVEPGYLILCQPEALDEPFPRALSTALCVAG